MHVLVFSYAFPPLQVQVSPVVARTVAGLSRKGFSVDVVSIRDFPPYLPADESLISYVQRHSSKISYISTDHWADRWKRKLPIWVTPDRMDSANCSAFQFISNLNLENYSAVITFSPFHSINNVMIRVKRYKPGVRWIAYFCDPWANNPLEESILRAQWNKWQESRMLGKVDHLVHSSRFALEMMLDRAQYFDSSKAHIVSHCFDPELYPNRPKKKNQKVVLRFIGTLFDRRTPEPLFLALNLLINHRKDLKNRFYIEIVGKVEDGMLATKAFRSLPPNLVRYVGLVPYTKSLELMYDADILLLIEADKVFKVFTPSKLADYIGSETPIVGILSSGSSKDILKKLGYWTADPSQINMIEKALESALDYVLGHQYTEQYDENFRRLFDVNSVTQTLVDIIQNR